MKRRRLPQGQEDRVRILIMQWNAGRHAPGLRQDIVDLQAEIERAALLAVNLNFEQAYEYEKRRPARVFPMPETVLLLRKELSSTLSSLQRWQSGAGYDFASIVDLGIKDDALATIDDPWKLAMQLRRLAERAVALAGPKRGRGRPRGGLGELVARAKELGCGVDRLGLLMAEMGGHAEGRRASSRATLKEIAAKGLGRYQDFPLDEAAEKWRQTLKEKAKSGKKIRR